MNRENVIVKLRFLIGYTESIDDMGHASEIFYYFNIHLNLEHNHLKRHTHTRGSI